MDGRMDGWGGGIRDKGYPRERIYVCCYWLVCGGVMVFEM